MAETQERGMVWELAVQTVSSQDKKRVQEGDILTIRKPLGYIGKKEGITTFWLLVNGLTLTDVMVMKMAMETNKRRFYIRLQDLQVKSPSLDLNKLRDPNIFYQIMFNPETRELCTNNCVIYDARKLVKDKLQGIG